MEKFCHKVRYGKKKCKYCFTVLNCTHSVYIINFSWSQNDQISGACCNLSTVCNSFKIIKHFLFFFNKMFIFLFVGFRCLADPTFFKLFQSLKKFFFLPQDHRQRSKVRGQRSLEVDLAPKRIPIEAEEEGRHTQATWLEG